MTDRRRNDSSLARGLAAGILGTLLCVAGMDLAATRGLVLESSLFHTPTRAVTRDAEPASGTLVVPESVARVVVDGTEVAPEQGSVALSPGTHRIELFNELNDPWVTRVEVHPGRSTELVPDWTGELIVDMEKVPPGAVLRVDGTEWNEAGSAVREMAPGPHVFSLQDGDELVWESTVTVRAGAVHRIVPERPAAPPEFVDASAAGSVSPVPLRIEPQPN